MRSTWMVVGTALAGALLLSGCSSAATRSSPTTKPPTTPDGSRGAVQLVDYTDNDGTKSTVVLTGAVGDYGHAVSVDANGKPDPEHRSQLELALTRGTFRISIAALDEQIVSAFRDFPPDRSTCSGTVRVSGAAPIVAGGGTGAYRGIHGRFNLTITIAEVDARSNCGPSSAFLSQAVVTAGSGTVSLRP